MPESKYAKKLTKAIKSVDKFLRDLQKDGEQVLEALKELKEGKDEDEPETK